MPLTTPITFTSSDQRQSLTWCSQIWPSDADPIPALLHTTCDRAERVERRVAQGLDRLELGDVGDDTDDVAALVAQLGRGLSTCLTSMSATTACMPSSVKRSTSARPMPRRCR